MLKRILIFVAALVLALGGLRPAFAANANVTLLLDGVGRSVSGKITLVNQSETSTVIVGQNGKASFDIAPGEYTVNLYLEGSFDELRLSGLKVAAPGTIAITLPPQRFVDLSFQLPSGNYIPNVNKFFNTPNQSFNFGGHSWVAPLVTPVDLVGNAVRYAAYVPDSGQVNTYGQASIFLSTATGTKTVLIPNETLLSGGIVQIESANYPLVSVSKISGAIGSRFTLTGTAVTEGGISQSTSYRAYISTKKFFDFHGLMGGPQTTVAGYVAVKNSKLTLTTTLSSSSNGKYLYIAPQGASSFPGRWILIEAHQPKSTYKNCQALNLDFQGGISGPLANGNTSPAILPTYNAKLYSSVKNLDRDKDGIACEK